MCIALDFQCKTNVFFCNVYAWPINFICIASDGQCNTTHQFFLYQKKYNTVYMNMQYTYCICCCVGHSMLIGTSWASFSCSERMNLKKKNQIENYLKCTKLISLIFRFSKILNSAWQKSEKIRSCSWTCENNEKKKKKTKRKSSLLVFLNTVEWGIQEAQRGFRHRFSKFAPILLTSFQFHLFFQIHSLEPILHP